MRMSDAALEIVPERHEKGPLDRYKNQSLLLKEFGEDGLNVYNGIDGEKTAGDLLKETGISEDKFVEILEFMEKNGIITISTVGVEKLRIGKKPLKEEPKEKKKQAKEVKKQPEEEPEEEEKTAKKTPKEEEPAEEEETLEEEPEEKKPAEELEEEEKPIEEEEEPTEEEEPEEEEKPRRKPSRKEEEKKPRKRAPPREEEPEEEEEETSIIKPIPEEKPEEEEEKPEEKEEEAPPVEEEEEIEKKVEEEAPEEEEAEEGKPEEEVKEEAPAEEEKPPVKEEAALPKKKPEELSPFEKIIHDKYGDVGVEIYNLIDGEKTAEEILVETGISEVKLVEILEFMDSQGIIRLEKPEEEAKKPAPAPSPEKEMEFKPMTEEMPFQKEEEARMGVAGELVEIVPIDVPMKVELNILQRAQLTLLLTSKYRDKGLKVYNAIDGTKSMIDLAVEAGMSLNDLDLMLGDLGKNNMLLFRTLAREDVEGRYGTSGFSVYKRYGRDGILLYEMIGKAESLKDIIMRSRMEPKRAIEIFLFIHKVLGIDIPLDKKALYAQLGLTEE